MITRRMNGKNIVSFQKLMERDNRVRVDFIAIEVMISQRWNILNEHVSRSEQAFASIVSKSIVWIWASHKDIFMSLLTIIDFDVEDFMQRSVLEDEIWIHQIGSIKQNPIKKVVSQGVFQHLSNSWRRDQQRR